MFGWWWGRGVEIWGIPWARYRMGDDRASVSWAHFVVVEILFYRDNGCDRLAVQ